MLNTIRRFVKLVFIFSVIVCGWTVIILLSNTKFNLEINELITKMYLNQKNFIINVKDLSLLLVKDANIRFSKTNHGINRLDNAKPD